MDTFEIVQSTGEPAFATDEEGRVVIWNREAERLLGYAASRVLGKPCHEILCGLDVFGNRFCDEDCNLAKMVRHNEPIRRFAMGAAGRDVAIEAADIALMSDDLSRIPWLIRHARRTLRVIRQNIVFSLAVKAAFVVLTFAGYASLWAAIAADMGASLLVIGNGLRLLSDRSGGAEEG